MSSANDARHLGFAEDIRTLLAPQVLNINSLSLLRCRGMKLSAVHTSVVSTHTAKGAGKSVVAIAGTLDGKRLAHDGTTTSEDLQVRHASGSGSDFIAGSGRRGGEGAKSGG
jgi:hypothetical protein